MNTKLKNLITQFRKQPLYLVLYLIFAIAIVKLYGLYFSVNVDDANWDSYSVEHNCKLLKTEFGTQKASWKCDDGKVYFRWMHQR